MFDDTALPRVNIKVARLRRAAPANSGADFQAHKFPLDSYVGLYWIMSQ